PGSDNTSATPPTVSQGTSDSTASNTSDHDWSRLLNDGSDSTPLPPPTVSSTPSFGSTAANSPVVTASDTHVSSNDLMDSASLSSSPATRPTARTHVVAEGETFYTIAEAEYGDGRYYLRLADANPGVNPNDLKVGQVLQIPDLSGGSDSSASAAANSPDDAGTASIDPTRSYRVQSGDTLERIARKLYGRGQDWEKIYDLNKDQIGPNPGRLTLNMVLRLPEPPTVASAN
ncbi:MAG TPA: LysM domain-containing protein, partial [Tepidisphaeraceae bacterium]|nr:LysM domain-containing protein [Tepidisphaeraceae bacterium]